jgi:hypothetical protein
MLGLNAGSAKCVTFNQQEIHTFERNEIPMFIIQTAHVSDYVTIDLSALRKLIIWSLS